MSPIRLRVKELRAAKGWTQQQLADKAGVVRVTISRIESETNRRIDYDTLERLADAFSVDPGLLIVREAGRKAARSSRSTR
jgi:transcriptional regulator with XRE-family HTH domain